MQSTHTKIVRIEEGSKSARLSPAQKLFNSLVKKIATQKQRLQVWNETIPLYQKRVSEELLPLRKSFAEQQVKMAHLLTDMHGCRDLKVNEKNKIAHMIQEICAELISTHGMEDMKAIYNQFSEIDFDTEEKEFNSMTNDLMKAMMENDLGISLDDDIDVTSPQGIDAMRRKLEEIEREKQERRATRKKTAKQLEKDARQQEEESHVSKSIKAVYRQLVAALHPDREIDPVEQARKTELMKQVTVAYEKKDLLQLLELQLATEQIDQSIIDTIAEDRLKHFNKILQRQLNELQGELKETEFHLMEQAGLIPFESLTPGSLMRQINNQASQVRQLIEGIKHDLVSMTDVSYLRGWLKGYKIPKKTAAPFFGDMPF